MNKNKFTLDDNQFFAELSGDYNPIHIDPIISRRYMFGEPIVHGMHVLFWSLESWLNEMKVPIKLEFLKISFPKAVVLEKSVLLKVVNHDKQSIIEVKQNDILCAKIKILYTNNIVDNTNHINTNYINDNPQKKEPKEESLSDLRNSSGELKNYLKTDLFLKKFPILFKSTSTIHLASLLTATRLVGMHCPGLNSLISHMDFSLIKNENENSNFGYIVSKIDERFNMLFIDVTAQNFNGKIKTFMRPSPVNQLKYIDVKSHLKKSEFKGQRVLVLGGSRGLGEMTTKILAAGGASVRFTYNRGLEEAIKIENEIISNGGKVKKIKLDVTKFSDFKSIIDDAWIPTHCYYFPTPFIFSGVKGVFSENLFNQFNTVYISSFMKIISFLREKGTLNYFYPSSTAIDEMPDNMVEYTISKYSAQKMCEFIRKNDPSIKIELYDFPRMETDQTVSFLPVKNHDPLQISLSYIREFNLNCSKNILQ